MADEVTDDQDDKKLVNRRRRFLFTAALTGYSVFAASSIGLLSGFGFIAHNLTLIDTLIDGLLSLATGLSLAYIGGSVIDYNGGVAGTFMGAKSRRDAGEKIPPPDPDAKG